MTRKELRSQPCACCGSFEQITLDHVKPKALGGNRNWKQPLCYNCNRAKGILTIDYTTKTFHLEDWMLSLEPKDLKKLMYKTHNFSCEYRNPNSKLYKRYHEM